MAKHRTKKQKINPHHSFLLSWSNEPKKPSFKASVKGQNTIALGSKNSHSEVVKMADESAKESHIQDIKRSVLTSLILASFILGLEVVIYLAWYAR